MDKNIKFVAYAKNICYDCFKADNPFAGGHTVQTVQNLSAVWQSRHFSGNLFVIFNVFPAFKSIIIYNDWQELLFFLRDLLP